MTSKSQQSTIIANWITWQKASGAPATTINLRRYYIRRLADAHRRPLLALDQDDLTAWISDDNWAPNTRKSARSALRSFYGWAEHTGKIASSPAHLLPTVRVPRARPKPTPERSYQKAIMISDPRARLAILLAGQCGLRRGEVAQVHSEHVEEDLCGYTLRVRGKGGHVRSVPLPDALARTILEIDGPAFPSPYGGHLTPHHVAKLVRAYLPAGVSMHTLRHRCATTAYAATNDLRAVQELLGHTRPETTAGYVAIPDDAIRAAVTAAAA